MFRLLIMLVLLASSGVAQPERIDGELEERTEYAPPEVVEAAREYVLDILGQDVGSTCIVSALPTTKSRYGGSGPIEIKSWYISVQFRPRPRWDEECRFQIYTTSGDLKYLSMIDLDGRVGYLGQIPDCAMRPELCEIEINQEAAIEIAKNRGIDPEIGEFNLELTIYSEPKIVWKVESKPGNGKLPHRIFIDAVSGGILRDFEGRACR